MMQRHLHIPSATEWAVRSRKGIHPPGEGAVQQRHFWLVASLTAMTLGVPRVSGAPPKNKCLLTFACSVSKTILCCTHKKRQGRGVQSRPCWTSVFSSVQWALSSVLHRLLVTEKGTAPALFWTLYPCPNRPDPRQVEPAASCILHFH